ncbi:MAG TPA: outer membrane protein assembly factor BamC [Burkholderiales bacterium]|nr:outer membrane protein assembly factor BamC [Burkholderiales bacterium]
MMRKALGCAVAALALAACSSFEVPTKKIDYKSAGKTKPLEVPPDLIAPSTDDRYRVPDVNPRSGATFSAYNRERSGPQAASASPSVLPNISDARIERAGTQRWLVVKGEPTALWQVVKDFWQETGFIVNVEIPEAGVMETDWAENRAKIPDGFIRNTLGKLLDSVYSTSERDKFRTRLERGAESGTTEIYVSHRGMEEVFTTSQKEETKWQPRPPDPELEAEMLRRLMVRFGVQEQRAKQQLDAAGTAVARATLERGQGTLVLNEQFDRAWRRVGLALDRVGFTVEDRDRSKGLYYVRYIDPQIDNRSAENKGWLSKLKFWGNDDKPKQEQYRIQVKGGEEGAEVNVLNKEGTRDRSETSGRILSLLYEQLK